MKKVIGTLLVVLGYGALYLIGRPLALTNDAVSRVWAKAFYPLRFIELRQSGVRTENGTLQYGSAGHWILTLTVPRANPQNGIFGAHAVAFRVPSHLSPAVAATHGKIVDVTIGYEPDSTYFNQAHYVLRSFTLSP